MSAARTLKVGDVVPSTNTTAQTEIDDLCPNGVTNHIARMTIRNSQMTEQPGFDQVLDGSPSGHEIDLEANHYKVLRSPDVEKISECGRAAISRSPRIQEKREVAKVLDLAVMSYPNYWPEHKRMELYEGLASLISSSFAISNLSITVSHDVVMMSQGKSEFDLKDGSAPELAAAQGGGN